MPRHFAQPGEWIQVAQTSDVERQCQLVDVLLAVLKKAEREAPERQKGLEALNYLITSASLTAREYLAEQLAHWDEAPEDLLVPLAYEEDFIARSILHHANLSDNELLYVIAAKGAPHWRVIAARPCLGQAVADKLITKQELGTLHQLLCNTSLEFDFALWDRLEVLARQNPLLHRTWNSRFETETMH